MELLIYQVVQHTRLYFERAVPVGVRDVYNSWKSWKSPRIYLSPGHFCVRWSTALVSGHKTRTGYQIAYLSRNWSPYFIFATAPCCIKCISCDERWLELIITCSIKCSRFSTLHSRPKQCTHVLDFFWNPSWSLLEISWKFVQLNL